MEAIGGCMHQDVQVVMLSFVAEMTSLSKK